MAPIERKGQFHMRLSEGEESMLRALTEAEGLTASDLIRQMIRRAFIEKWNPEWLASARAPWKTPKKLKATR